MQSVVEVGPLAIAVERLAAVGAIWAFLLVATWLDRRSECRLANIAWVATGLGILAARAGFVADNWEAFAVEPPSILYLWQGGFAPLPGVAAAALFIAIRVRSRIGAVLLLSLGVISAAWLAAAATVLTPDPRPLPAGLALSDLDGKPVDLRQVEGPFVVNLWATWCPPCRREMPMIVETAAANPDVPILLLNQGEEPAAVRRFVHEQGLATGARVILDRNGRLASATGSQALPTTLFIARNGEISKVHPGEISRAALLSGLRDLRRGS